MTLRANMEIIAFLSGEGPGSRRNFLASVGAGWGFGLANPPCAWGNGLSRAAGLPQSGAGVVVTGSRGTLPEIHRQYRRVELRRRPRYIVPRRRRLQQAQVHLEYQSGFGSHMDS